MFPPFEGMRIICTIGIIYDSKINIQATIQLMLLKVTRYLRTGSNGLKRTVSQHATSFKAKFVPVCNTVKTVCAYVYATRSDKKPYKSTVNTSLVVISTAVFIRRCKQ